VPRCYKSGERYLAHCLLLALRKPLKQSSGLLVACASEKRRTTFSVIPFFGFFSGKLITVLGKNRVNEKREKTKRRERKREEREQRLFQNDCTKTGYRYGASPRVFLLAVAV
jgi:hypothetical protein